MSSGAEKNRRLCCALVTCFLLLNATLVVEWANAFSGSTLIYWQLRSSTSLLKVDNATDMAVKQFARYVENNTSTSVQTNVESPFTETKNERSFVNFVETRRRESPSIVTTRTPVPRNTNKERQNTHPGTYPSPKEFNCSNSREVAHVENILCMKIPKFLPNYKNPCIRENSTGLIRCLPYFHLFGVCKSGTTDLFSRILHHPRILPNKGILSKETWFWSWRRYGFKGKMNFNQYMNTFPSVEIEKSVINGTYHNLVTGSSDPMDFWDSTRWRLISQNDPKASEPELTTPYLIRHMIPDIRLIVLLRDPIERTYSHYLHGGYGNTLESFHQHVVDTITHLTLCERAGQLRACVYERDNRSKIKAPMHASLYYLHLTEWFKVFPRQQILILTNEDMRNDTVGLLRHVFDHLKLDPLPIRDMFRVASLPKKYVTQKKKLLGPMFPKTKEILTSYFRDSIYKLVSLLNDDKYLKWLNR